MIRNTRSLVLLFVFALVAYGHTQACMVPGRGARVHHDYVIWEAETIVLVRLKSRMQMERRPEATRYVLETVETIKGPGQALYEFVSRGSRYSGNDFGAHKASEFWAKDQGRSEFPCCICGPDHSFREGEIYLYFPDELGSMKSAELVRDESDRWLTYVRARVKSAANPTIARKGHKIVRRFYAQ